ncbi:hypothetical protein CLAIMM_07958 isoform 3 [Cladophialophora immunda]|nr:hypothetical protein CLAIMM_07958 isoform 3 [Cladophialophora immunda]
MGILQQRFPGHGRFCGCRLYVYRIGLFSRGKPFHDHKESRLSDADADSQDPVWKHRKSRDDPAPGFDYEAWKKKHIAFADEVVPGWVEAVKAQFGSPTTKYACVGYCFGAPYVCNELARDICTAGAFAHPAFLKETHFRRLKKPLFLSCAETDHTFGTAARNDAIKILQEDKKPYNLQLFSGVEHGFALRCNLDNPYERYAKEESLRAIAQWFDFWLAQ